MASGELDNSGPRPEEIFTDPAMASSELDALVAAFEAKERRAQEDRATAGSATTLDPLAGATDRPVPVVAFSPAAETSDIDSLILRASAAPVSEVEPTIDSPEIDRAFEELSAVAAEDDSYELPPARLATPDSGADPADQMLTIETPVEGAASPMDDASVGAPVDDPEAALDDEREPVVPVELDTMDEVLAPVSESPHAVAELTMEDRAADEAAGLPPAAPILDSITQTTVIEEIGSENVAAGAVSVTPDFAPRETELTVTRNPEPVPVAPEPKPTKTAPAPTAAVPPSAAVPDASKGRWLPPSPFALMLEQPLRTAAALGSGVFVGVLTLAFLLNNPLQRHDVAPGEAVQALGIAGAVRTAQALMEQHDYKGAITLINAALERAKPGEERYADALFLRAESMVRIAPEHLSESAANALHAAIDDAVEAGHEHPKTGEALMWKAQVYEREGNIPAARAELRGILENYGNTAARDAVMLAMAELELRTGRFEESLDAAERLVDEHPGSPLTARARIVQGDAYVARGNPKAARAVYMLATAEHPDSATAMAAGERLGTLSVESGQPQEAIEELERRLDTATTVEGNDAIYLVLARAYRATGQIEKARNILNELRQFFPESEITPAALVELSEVLDALGLHAEAGRRADEAAQLYPNDPAVLRRAGQMLADRGQPLGAAEKLAAAYDAGAHEPDVLLSAAGYYLEGGSMTEAQAAYARVTEEHRGSALAIEAQIGWARAARGAGDPEGAFTRLEELASANAGSPSLLPVLQELASLYRELGLAGEMIETYGKVAGITDEPAPLAEAAQALIEAGAADEGLQVARRVDVARLDAPQAYGLLQAWGRTLLRGNPDEAMTLLLRAHEEYPDQRTAEGVEGTLRAALTLGRSAQARALVVDLQGRAADRPVFERAAVQYADFLFERGDYTAADEAYAMVTSTAGEDTSAPESAKVASDAQQWSAYQRANAAYALGRLTESLPMYESVASSTSPYAADAKARAEIIRFEVRRRGEAESGLSVKEES